MNPEKVTKVELVESVYQNTGVEKKVIQVMVESVLTEIKNSLKAGATLELRGFGTFEVRLRKGREKARNPKTGAALKVRPHYVAAFRPGKDLKQAMWDLPVEEKK
ncbi:MAG: integration host factor subunit beta [Spirochaetaceae bacterium]|jgi:integration host factor subunit beta|nr:integration host factor subunit beta [Spirochaetaceae bacterium]